MHVHVYMLACEGLRSNLDIIPQKPSALFFCDKAFPWSKSIYQDGMAGQGFLAYAKTSGIFVWILEIKFISSHYTD